MGGFSSLPQEISAPEPASLRLSTPSPTVGCSSSGILASLNVGLHSLHASRNPPSSTPALPSRALVIQLNPEEEEGSGIASQTNKTSLIPSSFVLSIQHLPNASPYITLPAPDSPAGYIYSSFGGVGAFVPSRPSPFLTRLICHELSLVIRLVARMGGTAQS